MRMMAHHYPYQPIKGHKRAASRGHPNSGSGGRRPRIRCLTTTTTYTDYYICNMGEGEIIKDTYPPSQLGVYTVIQEIAEGTFGKVKSK